jgi:hypothetical protein
MPWTSAGVNNGVPQKVQGPNPSLTQITLPHCRQFGAAASKGCRVATQLQRRAAALLLAASEGLVLISSARIAWSRSASAVEEPCIGVPPVMDTLVVVVVLL